MGADAGPAFLWVTSRVREHGRPLTSASHLNRKEPDRVSGTGQVRVFPQKTFRRGGKAGVWRKSPGKGEGKQH